MKGEPLVREVVHEWEDIVNRVAKSVVGEKTIVCGTVQITRNLYASFLHLRVINTRQSSTRVLEFEFSHSRSRVTFEFECSSIRVVSFSTRAR